MQEKKGKTRGLGEEEEEIRAVSEISSLPLLACVSGFGNKRLSLVAVPMIVAPRLISRFHWQKATAGNCSTPKPLSHLTRLFIQPLLIHLLVLSQIFIPWFVCSCPCFSVCPSTVYLVCWCRSGQAGLAESPCVEEPVMTAFRITVLPVFMTSCISRVMPSVI